MHPILLRIGDFTLFGFQFGPIEVHSYGVLVALGFTLGTALAAWLAHKEKIDPGLILDLAFWSLLAGLVGARILFMAVNTGNYIDACFHPELPNPLNHNLPLNAPECWAIFRFWEGGLVWYGGLLGALGAGWLFVKRKGLSFPQIADIALTVVPLGHAVGRLGCFCAGCCYGRYTDSPLGIVFPANSLPYMQETALSTIGKAMQIGTPPLHPTQLYESAGEFSIFLILLCMRRFRRFHGQIALGFLMLYPILRSVVEAFRGDVARGLLIEWRHTFLLDGTPYVETSGFSTSQLISLLVVIGAGIWMALLLRRARREKA